MLPSFMRFTPFPSLLSILVVDGDASDIEIQVPVDNLWSVQKALLPSHESTLHPSDLRRVVQSRRIGKRDSPS